MRPITQIVATSTSSDETIKPFSSFQKLHNMFVFLFFEVRKPALMETTRMETTPVGLPRRWTGFREKHLTPARRLFHTANHARVLPRYVERTHVERTWLNCPVRRRSCDQVELLNCP